MTTITLGDLAEITEPGVYRDLDERFYHAQTTSLSHSGAKRILAPGCPALFRHEQIHGRPDRAVFDLGKAVHYMVLGVGAPIVEVEADDWRTNKAKAARDEARAAGKVPVLTAQYRQVFAMADAVLTHPLARRLFGEGEGEVSMFWTDERTGVLRRLRLDWLPAPYEGRLILADLKSADSAEPGAFGHQAGNLGYYMQHPWYIDGAIANGYPDDLGFVFVVVEKTPPYLVGVRELTRPSVDAGRRRNARALDLFASCVANDEWPGYTPDDQIAPCHIDTWRENTDMEWYE